MKKEIKVKRNLIFNVYVYSYYGSGFGLDSWTYSYKQQMSE